MDAIEQTCICLANAANLGLGVGASACVATELSLLLLENMGLVPGLKAGTTYLSPNALVLFCLEEVQQHL